MDRVGRYQLLDKLGEGGMGVVYKAYDPLIERVVAVKLIGAARTDDPVLRERFFAEARAAGHLSHRNIVTVYDLGEDSGRPYFAMEFLEGQDLGRMIRGGQPGTVVGTIDLMAQAGRGLAYAHARGVVHRDVKPANIFVTTTGDVKVLDFGLARLARPLGSGLTRTRPFLGTVSYMAPEQVRGEPADARTDLFAFGVVLYEMLSGGRPAFETDSFASTMHRILTEEPAPLAALDSSLPPGLIEIVQRALAKSRDDRYQRVDDMLVDLAAFRTSLHASGEPPRAAPARSSLPETPGPGTPSLNGLGVTVGHEAAVDVRTPPPHAMLAAPSPSPAGHPSPSSGAGHARPWRPRPRVAALVAVAAAALAMTIVWRATGPGDVPTAPAGPVAEAGQATGSAGLTPAIPHDVPPAAANDAHAPAVEEESTRTASKPSPKRPPAVDEAARSAAQAALVASARAKGRAESAGADRLAPEAHAEALAAEHEAAGQFQEGAFAQARAGFDRVVLLFERAEADARAEQARRREEEQRSAPPPAADPPRPPAVEVPTIPAPTRISQPEPAILAILPRYSAALEARSLSRLKQVWPGLGGAQERAIADEFQHARSIAVSLAEPQVSVQETAATVSCRRTYRLETQDGQRLETVTRTVFTLRQSAGGWVIDHVRHEQW
jgi:serine/threonine-protein kinase